MLMNKQDYTIKYKYVFLNLIFLYYNKKRYFIIIHILRILIS